MKFAKSVIFCILLVFGSLNLVNSLFKGCDKEAWKWCEQSRCTAGCECRDKPICKQVCTTDKCLYLLCVSKRVCTQSVIPQTDESGLAKVIPIIRNMKAVSTNIEQDCSLGYCGLVAAIKTKGLPSKALQVCVNGICKQIISNVDYTRQLAENVDEMRCDGSTTCDQVCVVGNCKMMYCNSQRCTQRCSVGSTCTMVCGKDTVNCQQTCAMGSSCSISCLGSNCSRNCTGADECKILNSSSIIFAKGSTTQKPFEGNASPASELTTRLLSTTRQTEIPLNGTDQPHHKSSAENTVTTLSQTKPKTPDGSENSTVYFTDKVKEPTTNIHTNTSTIFQHIITNTRNITSQEPETTKPVKVSTVNITGDKINVNKHTPTSSSQTILNNNTPLRFSKPKQTTDMNNYVEDRSTGKDKRTIQKPDRNNNALLTESTPVKSSSISLNFTFAVLVIVIAIVSSLLIL